MFSRPSNNHSSHLIIIKDNSIIISLVLTVIMVAVAVMLANTKILGESGRLYTLPFQSQALRFVINPQPLPKATGKAEAPNPIQGAPTAAASTALPGPPAKISVKIQPLPGPSPALPVRDKVRLTTIRGGRHTDYASIVFQSSDTIEYDRPRIQGGEIRFKLKDIITRLRPFRKYKTFSSWVKLERVGSDLNVRIGVPSEFIRLSAFLMETPPRLVINIFDRRLIAQTEPDKNPLPTPPATYPDIQPIGKKPADVSGGTERLVSERLLSADKIRLTTIRGGRHADYASIVLQSSDRLDYEQPRIQGGEIRFKLKAITTRLRSFRKYRTFDSWVKLEKVGSDLNVRIGIPPNFIKLSAFSMKNPPRLVINLYDVY